MRVVNEKTIFTRIIEGELPCYKLYEDEHVIAFLDIQPLTRGHSLVVPKEPAPSIDQLSPAYAEALGRALPPICRAVMDVTGARAYNLVQNNGREAGMSVAHVHFHIIPRYPESTHSFLWEYGEIDSTDAPKLAESISEAMD
ncbi:MAG: diadenosine tetraphosphate hydrolase [Euryarchaeota archaeon]|nr:diadenosine tetraphosphate hydrolase [Euryarchaeota archaeon]|tara:strand:- start:2122 stop:2547 length:426 start_codon:yes stop_codon:yes gene_type:complete